MKIKYNREGVWRLGKIATFKSGDNEISEETLNAIKKHPTGQKYLDNGILEVYVSSAVMEKSDKKIKKK